MFLIYSFKIQDGGRSKKQTVMYGGDRSPKERKKLLLAGLQSGQNKLFLITLSTTETESAQK